MKALTVAAPVLVMIAAGLLARHFGWVSKEMKNGAWNLVTGVLFPILIFSLMMKVSLKAEDLGLVAYILIGYILIYLIARRLTPKICPRYAHFASYLLMTNEGGNIALPLFLSLVKTSSITVVFDLAVITINFIIVPILTEKSSAAASAFPASKIKQDALSFQNRDRTNKAAGGLSEIKPGAYQTISAQSVNTNKSKTAWKTLFLNMLHNPFLIAVAAGLVFNFSGMYSLIQAGVLKDAFNASITMLTSPITGMILFCLGYDLKFSKNIMKPVLKLSLLKTILYGFMIAGFFILFPTEMKTKIFCTAVFIYFLSPTSFGLIPMLNPLFKTDQDRQFCASFTSFYLLITLCVFVVCAFFYA